MKELRDEWQRLTAGMSPEQVEQVRARALAAIDARIAAGRAQDRERDRVLIPAEPAAPGCRWVRDMDVRGQGLEHLATGRHDHLMRMTEIRDA